MHNRRFEPLSRGRGRRATGARAWTSGRLRVRSVAREGVHGNLSVPPRRDVEGEIYAQLYGKPSEPPDPGATRVIGPEPRELPPRLEPEPPPPPRRTRIHRLGLALGARFGRLASAVGTARARAATAPARRRERRAIALGALLAGVVALGAVAGLSVGSGGESPRPAAPPSEPSAAERAADVAAAEARESRRRRAARKRRLAREQAREERAASASASAAPAESSGASVAPRIVESGCPTRGGCYTRTESGGAPEGPDGARDEQPEQVITEEPSVGTGSDGDVSTPDIVVPDVDVDVDVGDSEGP